MYPIIAMEVRSQSNFKNGRRAKLGLKGVGVGTGRKTCALQVHPVVPYKAIVKLPKALYGTTGGTCSARIFHPVIESIGHDRAEV